MFDLFNGQQESSTQPSTEISTAVSFDRFWAIYPRKVAKQAAQKAWKRMKPRDQALALDALPAHLKLWDAEDRGREFIPHAATWLNGCRWEDEIEMPKPKPQPQAAWWTSEESILAKGRELGLKPRGGEGWHQFKGRIMEALKPAQMAQGD